ncbi:hypothetical protein TPHA_0B01250 [Tetrapisispora phaffii CBS 4417]|uniref:GATA-type domain-containing protein n=1 Tax=Tetrapisispora phaffii (strain ATCC 24235 / CBS 4417 / NBRC 1672 / NRRL Y-8282 / UCD 70-5) TaxID=1071381 RepID=G8BP67_TETPH|nr:hypothetical protein TPHA_0B01250 [Tetrapisispora phaffii CBS 4417]CCE61798.1 hypothetical protein TPHA_0B01250 [Tetrapisispora phaffii CBS 4417]
MKVSSETREEVVLQSSDNSNLKFISDSGSMPHSSSYEDLDKPVCNNCLTSKTPLWRRDEFGSILCNACGLFLKLHGKPRPVSLKTDVILKRNRIPSNARSSKADVKDDSDSSVCGTGTPGDGNKKRKNASISLDSSSRENNKIKNPTTAHDLRILNLMQMESIKPKLKPKLPRPSSGRTEFGTPSENHSRNNSYDSGTVSDLNSSENSSTDESHYNLTVPQLNKQDTKIHLLPSAHQHNQKKKPEYYNQHNHHNHRNTANKLPGLQSLIRDVEKSTSNTSLYGDSRPQSEADYILNHPTKLVPNPKLTSDDTVVSNNTTLLMDTSGKPDSLLHLRTVLQYEEEIIRLKSKINELESVKHLYKKHIDQLDKKCGDLEIKLRESDTATQNSIKEII